jgi:hypothetical protein
MGTLFERALDESQRSQLGAHYTSEADIRTLVEPVLMAPLRREWAALKGELAAAYAKGKGTPAQRERLVKFQKKLSAVTVLDPACGSGNFLYVSLQLLLSLEKEVIAYATQLGFAFKPQVNVQQLRAIEINPYAFELAQVSVQIGYLQWRRDNGFDNDRTPVLQNLDGFQNEDALPDVPQDARRGHYLDGNDSGNAGQAKNCAVEKAHERRWAKVGRNPQTATVRLSAKMAFGWNQSRANQKGKYHAKFRTLDAFRNRISPTGQAGRTQKNARKKQTRQKVKRLG